MTALSRYSRDGSWTFRRRAGALTGAPATVARLAKMLCAVVLLVVGTAEPRLLAQSGAAAPAAQSTWQRALPWMLAGAALVATGLAVPALRHLRETPAPETRAEIVTPAAAEIHGQAAAGAGDGAAG